MIYPYIKNAVAFVVAAFFLLSCSENKRASQPIKTNPMDIHVAIDHYAINVEDLTKSVTFYQDIFNLQEIKNGTGLSHIRWFRLGTSQELHIIAVDSLDKKLPKGVHLALAVSDFDRFRKKIQDLKIDYSDWPGTPQAISTRPDNIRQLYFQDPDGYWVEVNDGNQF